MPRDTRLDRFMRPLPTLEVALPVRRAVEQLLEERDTIALVVDGGTRPVGLVTLEDLLEAMLGLAITDEPDDLARLQAPSERARQRRILRLERAREERNRRLGIGGTGEGIGAGPGR